MTDVPTEESEQIVVVQYLELKGHKFTAIPNSTYTKSWNQKRKNTATGLRAGFPDLVAIIDGNFIAIEMKRVKGSVVSKEQKEWIEALQNAGVETRICRGADEAIKFIRTLEDNE